MYSQRLAEENRDAAAARHAAHGQQLGDAVGHRVKLAVAEMLRVLGSPKVDQRREVRRCVFAEITEVERVVMETLGTGEVAGHGAVLAERTQHRGFVMAALRRVRTARVEGASGGRGEWARQFPRQNLPRSGPATLGSAIGAAASSALVYG